MQIENNFEVPVPPAEAWAILTDVQRVVPCVPGAELTEIVDDNTYKGKVSVKLGPVALAFAGEARYVERDDDGHRARMSAAGREAKGRGGANAEVDFALTAAGEGGTLVHIATDLQLSGPIAQYGRSAGIIKSVSEEMTARFADCLRQRILAERDTAALPPCCAGEAAISAVPAPASAAPAGGLSILWGASRRWLAGLFGGNR